MVYVGRDSGLFDNADIVLTSGSDKSLRVFDAESKELIHIFYGLHGASAAIRVIIYIGQGIVVTGGMDGRFVATDLERRVEVGSERAHTRFMNSVTYNSSHSILASAGFDGYIRTYKVKIIPGNSLKVTFTPLGSHKFLQIPTALALVETEDTKSSLTLLACTQDSTVMNFLAVPKLPAPSGAVPTSLPIIRKVNLVDAEFSMITFTPMHIAIAPDGSNRYAVATSNTPNLRIILGNLKEDGIERNLHGYAPQDKFSIPRIKWSSDGKGIWTIGDDGILRGIEAASGKLVAELRSDHNNKVSTRQFSR